MSLNKHFTVAIDMGKAIAMESKTRCLTFVSLLKNCDGACPDKNF